MSTAIVVERLDRLLKPLGFARKKHTWNRAFGSFVDVVDVQVSKAGDSITFNAGVTDIEVSEILWGSPRIIQEPLCIVRARVGTLIDGYDKWWEIREPGLADDVAEKIATHVLPFLDRLHTREALRRWLIEANVVKKRYPPPIIGLAILESLLGDAERAREILADVQKGLSGGWGDRANEVAERLHM